MAIAIYIQLAPVRNRIWNIITVLDQYSYLIFWALHEIFPVEKFKHYKLIALWTIVTDTLGTSTIDKLEADSFYFYAGELILSFKQCNLLSIWQVHTFNMQAGYKLLLSFWHYWTNFRLR